MGECLKPLKVGSLFSIPENVGINAKHMQLFNYSCEIALRRSTKSETCSTLGKVDNLY